MSRTMNTLRKVALSLADVSEGIACEGTALERRTVKVAGKAFLFLGAGDAMVKLDTSLSEATRLAKKNARIRPGKGGWVKVTFDDDENPPPAELSTWIRESHALLKPAAKAKKKAAKTTAKRK